MESHSTPVLWEEHPAQLICWRDVTDRIISEEREKQLEHHLFQTQKMSALASMADRISRQYKNYMQIIGGNVELALSVAHPSEEYYTQLKKIESVVARSTELMNMFAAFSHETPTRETIDLNATLKELYPTLQCVIPNNITLRYLLRAKNRIQATRPIEIGQSIMNLVLNACEAMPEGGEIVLYSHDILPKGINAHSSPYVGLDIIDQGHGIPENIMPRIFDPFFTTRNKDRHLGLGLYTTYTMITGCGGFVECKNVLCGTRFKLWFPAKASAGNSAKIISFPVGGNETILLVDDNQDINVTTVDYLRRFGYNVIPMYCAEEALHFYEKAGDTVDLVIMDLVMPGMGGIEGIKKLYEMNSNVKIIVASAYVDDIFTDSDAQALVSGVIHKPYLSGGLILNTIRKVLDLDSK
jgi:nitrogen-specific signal transduction histidine kinase